MKKFLIFTGSGFWEKKIQNFYHFLASGGIMGFVKSASVPSLGAGLAFGAILGYGAFRKFHSRF